MRNSATHHRRQTGAVLIISLIFLLVMTMLALSSSGSTRIQERMAGNSRDMDIAFQSAEAGVRNSEAYLESLTAKPYPCATAPCSVFQRNVVPVDLADQNDAWWTANATEYGVVGSKDIASAAADPSYVIEEGDFVKDDLTIGGGPPSGRQFYRLAARGFGKTTLARAVVQTTYTRHF